VSRAILLSAAVTSASSKTNAATLNLLPKMIYALCVNGRQVYHIFTKKLSIPPSLPATKFDNALVYFENLDVIPSRFDGSRNTPKRHVKFRRATEIFKKKEEVQLLHPLAVRGLMYKTVRVRTIIILAVFNCHSVVLLNPHMLKVILVTFVLKGGKTTPRVSELLD